MELISYAQNYEDIRLWRAFRDVEKGRYLDIGTQDPNHDSVSRLFYDRGWRGVHVEPTPHYAAAMREARPDEKVIEAAVSCSPIPIVLYEIANTGLSTGLADIAKFHEEAGFTPREILVPTVTLANLFALMGQEPIHWLKIDVEGMEADVIESWGDHPARPAALVIEATKPNTQEQVHGPWHGLVIRRGYREVLFDGLSRYFIHETHEFRGEALSLSPNVFDGFQILRTHFSAGRIAAEIDRTVQQLRSQAESLRQEHAEQLAQVTADAAAQLDTALQHAAELEGRLASESEANVHALDQAQTAVTEASAQLDAALQRANQLEGRLVADAEAHARALSQAQSDLDDASTQLAAALERAAALDGQLVSEAAAHAAEIAKVEGFVAEAAAKRDEALRKAKAFEQELAAATASHEAASAKAAAALAKVSTKLELSQARSTELQVRLREQARFHAVALRLAEAGTSALQNALAEMSGKLAGAQAEQLALGRLAGQLEGKLKAQKERFAASLADSVAQREQLRACLAETGEQVRQLREESTELASSLTTASEQRDALAAQARDLNEARDELAQELNAIKKDAAQIGASLRGEIALLQEMLSSREQKLSEARDLLCSIPDPLTGVSGLRRAFKRWVIGSGHVAEIVRYRAAALEWQRDTLPSQFAKSSEGNPDDLDYDAHSLQGPLIKERPEMLLDDQRITNVVELLAANGATFVHAAYWGLLGRGPDAQGEAYYLKRLRSGVHKLAILKQLRQSPEGQACEPLISGVDEAIKRHRLVNLPIIGVFLSLFVKGERDTPTKVAMRQMEQNVIVEMARTQSMLASGELKGALDWIDSRIGRLLEVSFDVEARTKDLERVLHSIAERSIGLHGAHGHTGPEACSIPSANAGRGRQRAQGLKVRDLHDRTSWTTVDDVLRHIDFELT